MSIDDMKGMDFSQLFDGIRMPTYEVKVPPLPQIDPKSTVQYKIQEQTRAYTEQSEQQIALLKEQNSHLVQSFEQLKALYEMKAEELVENKKELVATKKQNTAMLWVTIIACAAAVASAVLTALVATGVIG